jgi:hypothetical protein
MRRIAGSLVRVPMLGCNRRSAEVTERAFLLHRRTDRERDGAIACWFSASCRTVDLRQSAPRLAERHNAFFPTSKANPPHSGLDRLRYKNGLFVSSGPLPANSAIRPNELWRLDIKDEGTQTANPQGRA